MKPVSTSLRDLWRTASTVAALLLVTAPFAQGPTAAAVQPSAAIARPDSAIGVWQLRLPDEVRRVAGQLNMEDVTARITFKSDGTFQFTAAGARKTTYRGKFEVRNGELLLERLRQSDGWPEGWADVARASLDSPGSLTLEGLSYERSLGDVLVGIWVLQGDKGTRFELRKDGSFVFNSYGSNAQSKGRWAAHGGTIDLKYTEVDGQKVDYGMISQAQISESLDGFVVSRRFRYVRG